MAGGTGAQGFHDTVGRRQAHREYVMEFRRDALLALGTYIVFPNEANLKFDFSIVYGI